VPADDAPRPPRSLQSSAWRFVVAGGFNTLITGLLLSWLATVLDPRVAYTTVFAIGVGIAVGTAGRFVFGVRLTRRLVVLYVAMYLAVYLIGLGVVTVAAAAGMPPAWSGLVVLVTAPLTFVGGRLLLVRKQPLPLAVTEGTVP
jgi:putative flippase GtrA